ncbi:hypothetical protein QBC38DRAFT_493340 [Podospora fimiseda]|uniref:Uncharacterized protein n=1 Tax=Podospora fimiseda TaxID=252190 RepID=A0AAN7BEH6_9PEZI|nr:hypothetical protein QBC38DRAFT_493340 [Podospora fimiseda]
MSWSTLPSAGVYDVLSQQSHFGGPSDDSKRVATFNTLDVWELSLSPSHSKDNNPSSWTRRVCHPDDLEPGITRIILAPYPNPDSAKILSALLAKLGIPSDFASEFPHSVTHSIGSRETAEGSVTAWFHTLSKNIQKKGEQANVVQNIVTRSRGQGGKRDPSPPVPGTDETWARSAYCLSVLPGSPCPTLVCFGTTRNVMERLRVFRTVCEKGSKTETRILAEPFALFDLVVEGSFAYVDERVWRMCDRVYPVEKRVLLHACQVPSATTTQKNNFALLHNCSKQITHLRETVEGFLLLINDLTEIIRTRNPAPDDIDGEIRKMLIDNLRHRRSLFNNLRLRLTSLQRRVDNSVGLEFNLVTLQDSATMRRDASSMKIIAAITMVFLPTTAVASIVGSQIFTTNFDQDSGSWEVQTSPLFKMLWAVAGPLTVLVIAMSAGWNNIMESRSRKRLVQGT